MEIDIIISFGEPRLEKDIMNKANGKRYHLFGEHPTNTWVGQLSCVSVTR